MKLEDYFEFLPNNAIRIKGHRIGVEHVVKLYQEGFSPEEIAGAFPGLSLEKIYATITYYLHNQAELDTYIARGEVAAEQAIREYEAHEQAPVVARLRALKAQRRRQHDQPASGAANPRQA